MLDGYLAAVETGEVIDPEALVAAHPEIAERLRSRPAVLRVASRVEGSTDLGVAIDPALDLAWAISAQFEWSSAVEWVLSSRPNRSRSIAVWP